MLTTRRPVDVDALVRSLDEIRFLEDDKAELENQLRETRSMNHDLLRRCEGLEDENERLRVERDKFQAFAINLVTRLSVIGEGVQAAIKESGKHAIAAAGRQQELRQEAARADTALPLRQPMRVRSPHRIAPEEHPHVAPQPAPRQPIQPEAEPEPGLKDIFNRLGRPSPLTNNWP